MIIVTGGAGFIGSVLVWELNRRGRNDIVIVDRLGGGVKWRNLVGLSFVEYVDKDEFLPLLESGRWDNTVQAVIHMGACSSTQETDADYLMRNNTQYSIRIAQWWAGRPGVRFIYASSAATYGAGRQGYDDNEAALQDLRPLNMYGLSKHLFDLHAQRNGWLKRAVGLKFFNVFGPNEYHKGEMRSMICKAFPRARDAHTVSLFMSHRPDYADGEQVRDFVYVKDAVAMALFFLDRPEPAGIFNVGTGQARSWNACARALLNSCGTEGIVEYIPMPESLRPAYQYMTQAQTAKIRAAGCDHVSRSLETSIAQYVQDYLKCNATVALAPSLE